MQNQNAVFVVGKPTVARMFAPHMEMLARPKAGRIFAIPTMYVGLYRFSFPRGLTMGDYPFVGEPAWTLRQEYSQIPLLEIIDGQPVQVHPDQTLTDLLQDAEIYYAADPDASDAVNFHTMLSVELGEAAAGASYPAILPNSYAPLVLQKAFTAGDTTHSSAFRSLLQQGLAKRYFDFNFNVNALAMFGRSLREVGVDTQRFAISKFSLQFLYFLQDASAVGNKPATAAALDGMARWRGTGRYSHLGPGGCGLGSAASRPAILAGLLDAGLLVEQRGGGTSRIEVSRKGHAFLGRLHPDCKDLDLPFRLFEWQTDWPASKPKIERYLRTFFGKQKRYRPG